MNIYAKIVGTLKPIEEWVNWCVSKWILRTPMLHKIPIPLANPCASKLRKLQLYSLQLPSSRSSFDDSLGQRDAPSISSVQMYQCFVCNTLHRYLRATISLQLQFAIDVLSPIRSIHHPVSIHHYFLHSFSHLSIIPSTPDSHTLSSIFVPVHDDNRICRFAVP